MIIINEEPDGYGAAPMQATGTLEDGRPFYFRARHTTISLEVGEITGEADVVLTMQPWAGDRHPLSTFPDRHVRPLVEFLADILSQCEQWQNRVHCSRCRTPYTFAELEDTGGVCQSCLHAANA